MQQRLALRTAADAIAAKIARMHDVDRPAGSGALLALLAAALFGVSTPLIQHAGAGLGVFTTAALLYGGSALVGAALRRPAALEAQLRRRDAARLASMALFGACIGPVCLVWGLQRTGGTSASLMLTLEALFTALLARAFYDESMDRRVWSAMLLLLAGGAVLVVERGFAGSAAFVGLLAVLLATAAWAVDNALSRGLAALGGVAKRRKLKG